MALNSLVICLYMLNILGKLAWQSLEQHKLTKIKISFHLSKFHGVIF